MEESKRPDSLIPKLREEIMENSENTKEKIQEQSKKLTELGSILAKNQFSYKIEEKISKE